MRPSDGVFLLPLFAFVLLRYVENWPRRLFSAVLYGVLCLGWYIPTRVNASQADQAVSGQLLPLAHITSILFGAPLAHVAANMLRVLLPTTVAFWMLIPAWLTQRRRELLLILLLWAIPGYLFFLLVHMADAPYLTYMTAPLILLAAMAGNRKLAVTSLAICLVWNCGFFLGMHPVRSHAIAAQAVDYYTIKYTRYGIEHHWTSTVHEGAEVIP